jgi:hypothetical protein
MYRLPLLLLFLALTIGLTAQKSGEKKKWNPEFPSLFQHLQKDVDFVPTIKMYTSVKELMKNKSIQEEYYIPGTISITQSDGSNIDLDMEVKVRGNTRKKVCKFPPFKLNMKGADLEKIGFFGGVDKLKLVIQCDGSDRAFQNILKEMLVYDLYAAIDPNHMKVKLIKLEMYEDGDLKEDLNAFIVEDEDEYSFRKKARIIETGKINANALPRDTYFNMCFFQYMIANCDWSVANKHNIEIVAFSDPKGLGAIPYDFDYCGLVDNVYAVPPEHFPISNVRQRYFMVKQDMTPEEIDQTIAYFQGKRDEFMSIVDNFKFLDDKEKERTKSFLDDFYKDLENRDRVAKEVVPK